MPYGQSTSDKGPRKDGRRNGVGSGKKLEPAPEPLVRSETPITIPDCSISQQQVSDVRLVTITNVTTWRGANVIYDERYSTFAKAIHARQGFSDSEKYPCAVGYIFIYLRTIFDRI